MDRGKDDQESIRRWYGCPQVRALLVEEYLHGWGRKLYAKEMFLLGQGTNVRRHGMTHDDFVRSGSGDGCAWDYMPSSDVYQSILSYDDRFPIIQKALAVAVGSRTVWSHALAAGHIFKALKYRADLLRSFTFAIDIDAHGDDPDLAGTARQAYEIAAYVRDNFHIEMIINVSGGGMHLRLPDHIMAQVIDMDRLFRDNIGFSAGGRSWVDMRPINAVLVHMTASLVSDVFKGRANDVDINLHSNSDRVFRTLYSVHMSTGTVTLPVRLNRLESVSHADCHISRMKHGHNKVRNTLFSRYNSNPYTRDWTGSGKAMPRLTLAKVRNLLDLLYCHTPVKFHRYLCRHRLDED